MGRGRCRRHGAAGHRAIEAAQGVRKESGLPARCAPPASAMYSLDRDMASWISIAAKAATDGKNNYAHYISAAFLVVPASEEEREPCPTGEHGDGACEGRGDSRYQYSRFFTWVSAWASTSFSSCLLRTRLRP